MLLQHREKDKYLSLREKFLINLDKEIQDRDFEISEAELRQKLIEQHKEGKI